MKTPAQLAAIALLAAASAAQGAEPPAAPARPAMQPLSDGELRAVTRPLPWRLQAAAPASASTSTRPGTSLYRPGAAGAVQLRALSLLSADIEIRDVVYNRTQDWLADRDGSYKVPLPATIGEIDFRNIRSGPNDSLSFGSVQIIGVDLQNTSITVSRNR